MQKKYNIRTFKIKRKIREKGTGAKSIKINKKNRAHAITNTQKGTELFLS